MLLDTAGRDNNAITTAISAADLVIIPCHPTDLELSTLGPTLARLRADQISTSCCSSTGPPAQSGGGPMPRRPSRELGDGWHR